MASQRFLGRCSWFKSISLNSNSSLGPARCTFRTLCRISRSHIERHARVARRPLSTVAASADLPRKSLLRRTLGFFAIAVTSSALGFVVATAPAMSAADDLMSPPTDSETLDMFIPPDAFSAEINSSLVNHPIAQMLREDPMFIESRPYFKIPESARGHFLTGGVLSGPGLIWVPPLAFLEKDGKSVTILYYLGNDISGHPGIVHGGLQATLLDETLARSAFGALPNKVGMTANLNINYKAPMPTNSYIVARADLEKCEGRKAWVRGRLESATADGAPTVYVEATALFIEPKQAATMKRLYPAATATS